MNTPKNTLWSSTLYLVALIMGLIVTSKCVAESKPTLTFPQKILFKIGDDPSWAKKQIDDSGWQNIKESGLPSKQTQYWIRNHLEIKNSDSAAPYDHAVIVSLLGAYDIYWDGILLGRNGVVGTNHEDESPGNIDSIFRIPKSLYKPGKHIISLRVSSFYSQDKLRKRHYYSFTGPYKEIIKSSYLNNLLPLVMFGGILLIGLYYLAIYTFYQRKSAVISFSLLCFAMALLIFTESYRELFGYQYQWHWYRMILVNILCMAVGLLLNIFLLNQFKLSHKHWLILFLALVMTGISLLNTGFDLRAYGMFAVSLISGILIAVKACINKAFGSSLLLGSLIITAALMLFLPAHFMDRYLFVSFGFITVTNLTLLTLSLRKQQLEHHASLLNSARLETELLKKNIQPHFILNTLTAIEEWIEESPKTAVKFIESLAEEFRIMCSMTHEKLVPVENEIKLCRTHLKIMSFRQNKEYELNANFKDNYKIPPAIVHTLIENAMTHNRYPEGKIVFNLDIREINDTTQFSFSAPLGTQIQKEQVSSGTGNKYIEARLRESFGENWKIIEHQTSDTWQTDINIQMKDQ